MAKGAAASEAAQSATTTAATAAVASAAGASLALIHPAKATNDAVGSTAPAGRFQSAAKRYGVARLEVMLRAT